MFNLLRYVQYIILVCCYIQCPNSDDETQTPQLPVLENSVLHSLNYLILCFTLRNVNYLH